MHIKKITGLILVILVFWNYAAFAQQDEKAKEILDKLPNKQLQPLLFSWISLFPWTSQRDEIAEEFDGKITISGENTG
jgi:succinate dehydrogenase hydrophobic anchor subunit